ncbi:MAG: hypothetical protein M1831_005389 [Alyxoria varia]|nr:MAG: hypothetical protein M1831_005389 [Alyxoria varia]
MTATVVTLKDPFHDGLDTRLPDPPISVPAHLRNSIDDHPGQYTRFSFTTQASDRTIEAPPPPSPPRDSLASFYAAVATTPPQEQDFHWEPTSEAHNAVGPVEPKREDPNDEIPTPEQLRQAANLPVVDADGRERSFKSLFRGEDHRGKRQLIIFIRHFYCHACQAFIRALRQIISPIPAADSSIPIPTSITLIGCGSPALITSYVERTECPYPLYVDPTRDLYKTLRCKRWGGVALGHRPDYMRNDFGRQPTSDTVGELPRSNTPLEQKQTLFDPMSSDSSRGSSSSTKSSSSWRKRLSMDAFKGGPTMQLGGEFLFEQGRLIWFHRMKNMRGHAEMKTLRRVLELDDFPHT